jgi:hypothetical protein
MSDVELVDRGSRLEVRSPMRPGMRVAVGMLGLFPLVAPYELLVRPAWTTGVHPFFVVAAVVSLGAVALCAVLLFAAVAGLSSAMVFDRRSATVRAWSAAPVIRRSEREVAWSQVRGVEVETSDWSDGSPSYRLRVALADGTALESGSSWSRDEIEAMRDTVARFLEA